MYLHHTVPRTSDVRFASPTDSSKNALLKTNRKPPPVKQFQRNNISKLKKSLFSLLLHQEGLVHSAFGIHPIEGRVSAEMSTPNHSSVLLFLGRFHVL